MNSRFKFRVWDEGMFVDSKAEYRYADIFTGLTLKLANGKNNIEQCTGLKDKNGNLIYESDYVKIGENTYKVFWNNIKISLVNILNGDIIDISETITMEIIGNEHETKFDKI